MKNYFPYESHSKQSAEQDWDSSHFFLISVVFHPAHNKNLKTNRLFKDKVAFAARNPRQKNYQLKTKIFIPTSWDSG